MKPLEKSFFFFVNSYSKVGDQILVKIPWVFKINNTFRCAISTHVLNDPRAGNF